MTHTRSLSLGLLYGIPILVTLALIGLVGTTMGSAALLAMITLTALEITFSFDNAVTNAKVLRGMPRFWKHAFTTVGIVVAVFGVRIILPVLMVALAANMSFTTVAQLAVVEPDLYADVVREVSPLLAAFGGCFLLMIFMDYIFGRRRTARTSHQEEGVSILRNSEVLVTLGVLLLICVPLVDGPHFVFFAGCLGVFSYMVIRRLSELLAGRHDRSLRVAKTLRHTGFFTFLYLELLDATFSFDGVVSAFAVTPNVLLIAAGLGAGAIWVRSITVYFMYKPIPGYFAYLDAGVHYAIGALAILLLLGLRLDVPELLPEVVALAIVAVACLASFFTPRSRVVAKSGA